MKKLFLIIILFLPFISEAQNLDVIGNINTKGKIQINGNGGTTGQVLMSNGANPPAWTTVSSSTCATGGKFLMLTSNQTAQTGDFDNALNAATSQAVITNYSSLSYNTNSDVSIDIATGIITCNRTGLYHFEGMIRYFVTSSQTQIPRASIGYKIGNGNTILLNEETLIQGIPSGGSNSYNIAIPFSFNRYLTAVQTIKFEAKILNLDTNPAIVAMGISSGSSVSGNFVTE